VERLMRPSSTSFRKRRDRDEDAEDVQLKIMIETMVRNGCSEREIVIAVEQATRQRPAA
jgi:hypothetical protein